MKEKKFEKVVEWEDYSDGKIPAIGMMIAINILGLVISIIQAVGLKVSRGSLFGIIPLILGVNVLVWIVIFIFTWHEDREVYWREK